MGQIRKRGTFYQIRYYRNGQRIEESTDNAIRRRSSSAAGARRRDLEGCPDHGEVDAAHVR